MRVELPQIAFADLFATERAETLRTGRPAVDPDELHVSPPLRTSPFPRWRFGHSPASFSIVRRLMQLTLWFCRRILAFRRAQYLGFLPHTLVCDWDAPLNARPRAVRNRAWGTAAAKR